MFEKDIIFTNLSLLLPYHHAALVKVVHPLVKPSFFLKSDVFFHISRLKEHQKDIFLFKNGSET